MIYDLICGKAVELRCLKHYASSRVRKAKVHAKGQGADVHCAAGKKKISDALFISKQ